MILLRLLRICTLVVICVLANVAMSLAAGYPIPSLEFKSAVVLDPNIGIKDVCCGTYANKFETSKTGAVLIANSQSAIWLKLPALKTDGILDFGILAEDVTVYYFDAQKGDYQSVRNGKVIDTGNRININPSIHFELSAKMTGFPVYVKILQETRAPVTPIFTAIAPFEKLRSKRFTVHTLLIGAALVMMAFNLSLGIINRDVLFILNMLTVAGAFVANLAFSGIGPSYIWGGQAAHTVTIFTVATITSTAFAILFLYKFLEDPKQYSPAVRSLLYVLWLLVFPLVFWIAGPVWQATVWFSITNSIITIYAFGVLIYLFFRSNVRAKLMLPSLIVAILPGNIMFIMNLFFQMKTPVPLEHLFEFMMVSEALLFSLVLAYRIRISQEAVVASNRELQVLQADTRRRVLDSIDSERKRIASDLHDSAGQGLMSVANRLSKILRKEKLSENEREDVRKAADYSRSVIGDIRRISHELHPAIIDHLGWRNAVEELFNTLQETGDIDVELTIDIPENTLNETQELHLYRIVQEVISNISKHSDAEKCIAKFSCEQGIMSVEITDVSRNLLPAKPGQVPFSIGQTIIDQRINTLDGEWEMAGTDNGMCVSFSFPVQSEKVSGDI